MGPKRYSRSELIRFFDSQPPPAVEAADIIPIKKTRLAFLAKEGAPRHRPRRGRRPGAGPGGRLFRGGTDRSSRRCGGPCPGRV